MMADNTNGQANQQPRTPNPDLRSLDRLVGTCEMSGDTRGRVTYEWMEGGFFLVQHVDLEQDGQQTKGIEIIGHEQVFGGAERAHQIALLQLSGWYDPRLYVEVDGDTLMIWSGEKGSPAYYKGTFGDDDNTLAGAWVYPSGGYESISTRIA